MKSNIKNYITLSLCTLECVIFGGTLFGWPSLAYVYKDLGFFSCNNNETVQTVAGSQHCPDQDLYLPLALTVGIVAQGVVALPVGWLFDRFGLGAVRSVAIFAGVGGSLVLAFSMKKSPFVIYLGTFLIGAASIIIIITNHHVALLAGVRAPIFNLMNGGAVHSSVVVYFLVKLAYDYGFSPQWSLIVVACLWTLVVLTTFIFLPPYKVDLGEGASARKARSLRHPFSSKLSVRGFMATSPKMLHFLTLNVIEKGRKGTDKVKPGARYPQDPNIQSVSYYIKSFPYIMHVLYFNVLYVWNGLIIGIANPWLSFVYNRDQVKVSNATNLYTYIQIGLGLLFSPFAGVVLFWVRECLVRRGYIYEKAPAALRVVVTTPNLLLACVSYTLVAVFILLPLPASPYLVFVFTGVAKCLYSTTISVLIIMFPLEYFGVLFGLMVAGTTLTLPVQYGYLRWYEASGHVPMTGLILATLLLTFLHPIIIIINAVRMKARISPHSVRRPSLLDP